jgi:predicted nuclease of predicted toxin-antitoxin system
MRYLIDEDLSTDIARIARGLGLDIVSVHEIDREGWTDEQQLDQAAIDGRCIVTANRNHFEDWAQVFFRDGRPHAGVLIVTESLRRRGASSFARALAAFERTRGDFPSEYLCDFLQPAD